MPAMLLLSACNSDYSPKPRGYFRIDLPEKKYVLFDTNYPYQFEYPAYAEIREHPRTNSEPYWINIEYPAFNGTIHISYKTIEGNLIEYLEDSRTFVMKHIPKASGINDSLIENTERGVYGLLYDIQGVGAASPCQFILTDSSRHFIRGALYFDVQPNNDSLAPVISFMKEDIRHLINTFRWKEVK